LGFIIPKPATKWLLSIALLGLRVCLTGGLRDDARVPTDQGVDTDRGGAIPTLLSLMANALEPTA
jgi:hypothetical protein